MKPIGRSCTLQIERYLVAAQLQPCCRKQCCQQATMPSVNNKCLQKCSIKAFCLNKGVPWHPRSFWQYITWPVEYIFCRVPPCQIHDAVQINGKPWCHQLNIEYQRGCDKVFGFTLTCGHNCSCYQTLTPLRLLWNSPAKCWTKQQIFNVKTCSPGEHTPGKRK